MRRGAAAEVLGFARMDVLAFIDDHEDFEALVLDAEGKATEHVEEALYQAAVSGNVQACKMWLDLRKRPSSTALSVIDQPDDDDDDPELRELRELAAG